MRDDFSEEIKRTIAARVGYRCSRPSCRALTTGPQVDPSKSLNVGVAAHITAASPGGPRYNAALGAEERRHANNAIWLCQTCGKLVDNDQARFTISEIKQWKRTAEAEALALIGKTATAADPLHDDFPEEELRLLIAAADDGEIREHSVDQISGKWVEAGGEYFLDQSDPALAALYLDAFDSLRRKGLVRYEGGDLYMLTGRGFKIARALNEQIAN
jgi:uncharacterized protein YjhX (UPF0386 family)